MSNETSLKIELLNRRDVLRGMGGLLVGFVLPGARRVDAQHFGAPMTVKPNAYIHIDADSMVTFLITKGEMGQGTVTSLSQILADELDCDWNCVRTEFAPVDPSCYGPMQGVFGSTSIRTQWMPLRKAGAAARQMLMLAAAQKWNIDVTQVRTDQGFLLANGQRTSYGSVAEAAAKLPLPADIKLKDATDFRLIGAPAKRLDTRDKISGATRFGIDAEVPGMLYASLARCPVFGGKVARHDAEKAKAVAGVREVVRVSNGVAVVADNTWAAMQGRKALNITWDEGPNAALSSAIIRSRMSELGEKPGIAGRTEGDAAGTLARAAKRVESIYEAPYLAHACMEPLNCTASVRADGCDIWASTQMQSGARRVAARITGLDPARIQVHSMYMGGGFGRRGGTDFIAEAVEISKAIGAPVKLTWTREDDIQTGPYRPAAYVKFSGSLDSQGWPEAFKARVVCPSFGGGRGGEGLDGTAVEGIDDLEYRFPHCAIEFHRADGAVPTSYWRSVGYSQNTFFAECFLDELAAAGGKDPVEVRRRLLAHSPRMLAVLNLVAEKANWGAPAPGRYQGVALVNNLESFTAEVAEVSLHDGKVKVHRVVCAIDCGQVVNPAIVRQQVEGGIAYGLTAALKGEITIEKGRTQQSNFNTYDMLRISEMPKIDVHIVRSSEAPGGVGEASVPPIAPAVANAIFAATRRPVCRLPIRISV
ncbi:MAG TPA: xanthine dehydrogenase family protein molybdopterin-binding subunit [Acidobacteriaceae bacterium]|nr:xanthine dehydrogenase family protein molybdopterin-binding subunit [Acidobacteriaceae bacterium]